LSRGKEKKRTTQICLSNGGTGDISGVSRWQKREEEGVRQSTMSEGGKGKAWEDK